MRGFRHISTRLVVWILGGASIALFAIGTYWQGQTRRLMLEQASARAAAATTGIKEELQGTLRVIEAGVTQAALRAAEAPAGDETTNRVLHDLLASNDRIYGATVAYEPWAAPPGRERFAPYLYSRGHELASADLATPEYSYWKQEWYQAPFTAQVPRWTEPYFDKGAGDILMVTYAVPFSRVEGTTSRPAGIVTSDLALAWLKSVAEANQPGRNGFVIIFSGSGRLIVHPRSSYVQVESMQSLAVKNNQPELAFIQEEVAAGRSGHVSYKSVEFGTRLRVDYRPVQVGGWGIAVSFEEDEFLEPVAATGRVALGSALAALILLASLVITASRRITRPLGDLADAADRMATGDLETAVPPARTRDEIGHLAGAFGRMRDDLRRHIADLAATTAARQKLESELAIAKQIQRTMLPAARHTARGRHTAEIFARMEPAKAVGGDFFVYFPTASGILFFAAGDVSDKGVPAALFMTRTITLLRTIARTGLPADEVLRRVNTELLPDNDECMFVTLVCGELDLATGELACASAGHEPPLLLGAGGARFWQLPAGPALGLEPKVEFRVATQTLAPGETLLVYTDGVIDATDPAGAQFSATGLLAAAGRLGAAVPDPAAALFAEVDRFAAGTPPADDITVFAIRLDPRGPEPKGGAR